MLKWLGGCLLVLIVLLVGGMWFGMRAMRNSLEPDGSVRVTFAAPPERIFAALAHGDSIPVWMSQGNRVTTSRRGFLIAGDSIRVELRATLGIAQRPMTWEVVEIVPNQLLVLRLLNDTTGTLVAIRRDSLVAAGDSTTVISSLTSPMLDSLKAEASGADPEPADGVMGLTSDMMLSMFRVQSKLELHHLKQRIEAAPAR